MSIRTTEISLEEIVLTRIHVGHSVKSFRRFERKQEPYVRNDYVHCVKQGVAIINLTQTRIQIKKAQLYITLLRSSGKRVLFVSNEAHTLQIVERRRRATCSFFVNGRWLGGTLTNLATIQASLRMLVPKPGEGKTTTSQSIRESNKIATRRSRRQRYLDGLIGLNSIPGAVIILTQKTSLVAINECRKLGIPTISLVDTDCDLNLTTINIPINDDSSPRIHLFLEAILPSISMGRRWWLSIKVQAHKTSRGKWKSRNRMHLLK